MGLLGVARANTTVGVSPETFLLLLLQSIVVNTLALLEAFQLDQQPRIVAMHDAMTVPLCGEDQQQEMLCLVART
jgi:hypothetical protein